MRFSVVNKGVCLFLILLFSASFFVFFTFAKPQGKIPVPKAQNEVEILKNESSAFNAEEYIETSPKKEGDSGGAILEGKADNNSFIHNGEDGNTVSDPASLNSHRQIGVEGYLAQLTAFYEQVITILSILIFVVLSLIFIFTIRISNDQINERVEQYLRSQSFDKRAVDIIDRKFDKERNEGDTADLFSIVEALDKRIEFLEKVITDSSYAELAGGEGGTQEIKEEKD